MSWGGVSASLIFDVMKQQGYMYQLPLFLTPPKYTLDEKYICDTYTGYKVEDDGTGKNSGVVAYEDHPAFAKLRDVLESKGYIKVERNWSNGDRVLHDFWLNDMYFQSGEQFPCASALGTTIAVRKEKPELYEVELNGDYLPVRVPWKKEENDDEYAVEL